VTKSLSSDQILGQRIKYPVKAIVSSVISLQDGEYEITAESIQNYGQCFLFRFPSDYGHFSFEDVDVHKMAQEFKKQFAIEKEIIEKQQKEAEAKAWIEKLQQERIERVRRERETQNQIKAEIQKKYPLCDDGLPEIGWDSTTDLQEIYYFLTEERNVTSIIHFTPIKNLKSILEYGILPIDIIRDQDGIECPDTERLDEKTDCSCFTLSFPNYQVFYKKWHNDGHEIKDQFVVLKISIDALLSDGIEAAYFMPINAASRIIRDRGIENYCHLVDAKNMFCEWIRKDGRENFRFELGLEKHPEYTTCPQAELMIKGVIEPQYINGICFGSAASQKSFCEIHNIDSSIKLFSRTLFDGRIDSEFWKK